MSRAPTPEQIHGLLRMPGSRPPDGSPDADLSAAHFSPRAQRGDAQRRRQLTEAVNANAYIHARLLDARARYANDPDYATLGQRWTAEADKIVEDGLAKVSNERLRNKLRSEIAAPLAKERAAMEAQAFRGVAAAHAQTREQYLRHLIQNISTDPNDPLLTGGIHAYHATIDNARDRGLITPDEALAEKRRAALALCEGEYAGMTRRDPGRAIRELHGEATGHPLLAHLPPERKDALVREARERGEANRLDAALADRRRQQQERRASDEAEAAVMTDLAGAEPSVTADSILDNATLSPNARRRMLDSVARSRRPEPPPDVSAETALKLLAGIRRGAGDAGSINRLAPLASAYGDGRLSLSDFRYVSHQLAQAGSPDGETAALQRQALIDYVEPLIASASRAKQTDNKREGIAP
jgi:hypothetical protein